MLFSPFAAVPLSQSEAGIGKKHVEKLDWMYEGPMSSGGGEDAAAAEEYLLGKAFEPKKEKDEVTESISKYSAAPGALMAAARKPMSANDAFTRMHEDPMMKIKQLELKARESVVKNPLKMNKVKLEIEQQLRSEKDAKKAAKRAKKEAKKAKKREKKEKKEKKHSSKRSSSGSDSSDSEDERPRGGGHRRSEHEAAEDSGKREGYGLQRGSAREYSRDELGPSAEQRAKAKKEEPKPDFSRKRSLPMSEEERAARLASFREDAHRHERGRTERVRAEAAAAASEPSAGPGSSDPAFLRKMEHEVYTSGEIDLEERVKRNRQNHQRDGGSEAFLRR